MMKVKNVINGMSFTIGNQSYHKDCNGVIYNITDSVYVAKGLDLEQHITADISDEYGI